MNGRIFLGNVVRNDNCVCIGAYCLLTMLNVVWIKSFYRIGDDISSSCNLRNFITDTIFE